MLENGQLEHGCYGPLPGPIQTVPRAELHAICEALARTVGPIRIHTDHKPTVDGLLHGREWACCPTRVNADLWRRVWFLLDDLGGLGPQVQVVWVKAHQGDVSLDARGNNWADTVAKLGAAEHEIDKATIKEAKRLKMKARKVAR